jgi:hypothetical protein
MHHRLPPDQRGQRLHREIVWGGAKTTRGQYNIGVTLHSPFQRFEDPIEIVGEHRNATHQGAKVNELLCHPERIGILNAPHH